MLKGKAADVLVFSFSKFFLTLAFFFCAAKLVQVDVEALPPLHKKFNGLFNKTKFTCL